MVSMSHAQQILENRIIFQFNVVELQCNQVERELGAPPEILVIFGAYVYTPVRLPSADWGGGLGAWSRLTFLVYNI